MDYADNFTPKPIKGEKYTARDGRTIIVDDIQPDEGVVYVFCHYEGDEPNTMFPNKEEWESMFSLSDDKKYSIQLSVNPTDGGTVTGGGLYDKDTVITISATPSKGFRFVQWSDNDMQEQRNLTVTDNLQLEALFEQIIPKDSSNNGGDDNSTNGVPENSSNGEVPSANSTDEGGISYGVDNENNEYLRNVVEPLNKLKKLLQHGVTIPFQILRLETDEEIPAQFSDPNVTKSSKDELDKIENLRKEGEKEENKGTWVQEKMWSFGAFDKPMLRMVKQDHNTKTGLGAAIFITSLFAFFTGTYALYKITNNTFLSFILGIVWGLFIYILDRNIVASMNNKSFLKSLGSVIVRLIISVFIGISISTPFEMLIFNGKINEYKDFEHKQFVENYLAEKTNYDNTKIGEIRIELDSLKKELKHEETVNPYGVSIPGRVYRGPQYDSLCFKIREKQKELRTWESNVNTINKVDRVKYEQEAEEKWKEKVNFYDLSRDFEILHKVTAKVDEKAFANPQTIMNVKSNETNPDTTIISKPQQSINASVDQLKSKVNPALPKDNAMWKLSWFITILFIVLEVTPVLTKLFFKTSTYDRLMEQWAYLRYKLHCIEDASSYNQIINGALSSHREYIMGDRYEEIRKKLCPEVKSEDNENIILPAKGCLRTAKDYLDAKNLATWKSALEKANRYIEEQVDKLFTQQTSAHQQSNPLQAGNKSQAHSNPVDPSAGGEVID